MLKIAEYAKQVQEIRARTEKALKGTAYQCPPPSEETRPLNIVFVGQYSAGKSTIIRMLTGRNDIAVGAGITTERTNSYDWNGMVITDTPGIHTEQRPDHDEISYRAIAAADILIFVVTSQMFDANIAAHFRKLAIDNDKANEMILVVNKMQMTAEGNTPHQQEIIRGDIARQHSFTPGIKYSEDFRYINEILLDTCRMMLLKDPVYWYRRRPTNDSAIQSSTHDAAYYIPTCTDVYRYLFDLSVNYSMHQKRACHNSLEYNTPLYQFRNNRQAVSARFLFM